MQALMPSSNPRPQHGGRRALWAWALCGMIGACGTSGGQAPSTGVDTALPDPPDPIALQRPVGGVHVVSVANPDLCLTADPGGAPMAGTAVGTAPCTGGAEQTWRWRPDGNLGFAQSGLCLTAPAGEGVPAAGAPALTLASCRTDGSQSLAFAQGRLYLGAGDGAQAVLAASITAAANGFSPGEMQTAQAKANPPQQWRVGLARVAPSGDGNVQLAGVPLALTTSQGMCLTGRGITVGLAACNGSASQGWILGEQGGVQLGAYCLDATTPGDIAQGTPGQFALCRPDSPSQAWVVSAAGISLADFNLSASTVPPPAAGYTPTVLVGTQVAWRIGG